MILHMYFARRFMRVFLATLLIFLAFLTLIDLIEQMRRFNSDTVTFADILKITLFNAPSGIYQILPLVMILSSVSMFLALARSSELVVTRASGRAGLIMLISPVVVSAVIGVLAVALINPIVAATSKRVLELEDIYRDEPDSDLMLGREGLWLRQGDTQSQTVIHAQRSNEKLTELFDATFIYFNIKGEPTQRIVTPRAILSDQGWVLEAPKRWDLLNDGNPEEFAEQPDRLVLPTTLTEERIRDSFSAPNVIAIWDLPEYIGQLDEAGFSTRRHEVWLQMELARPLFLMAMVLVGAAFTMRHNRFGKTGVAVLASVMMGFGLYYVRNFAQILGENGQLPALVAAWTPPVASILLALGLLLHMEDG